MRPGAMPAHGGEENWILMFSNVASRNLDSWWSARIWCVYLGFECFAAPHALVEHVSSRLPMACICSLALLASVVTETLRLVTSPLNEANNNESWWNTMPLASVLPLPLIRSYSIRHISTISCHLPVIRATGLSMRTLPCAAHSSTISPIGELGVMG